MTPEDLEAAIRRIPEFAPPPDLERRLTAELLRRRARGRGAPMKARLAMAATLLFCAGLIGTLFLPRPGTPVPAQEARAEIDRLRSDDPDVRDAAARRLKGMGAEARAALEAASRDRDPEVARRAQEILRRIDIATRLSRGLREALPGIEDRLAAASDAGWTRAFLEAAASDGRAADADLDFLAPAALRGAASRAEKAAVLETIRSRTLRSASEEVLRLLQDPDEGLRALAADVAAAIDPAAAVRRTLDTLQAGADPKDVVRALSLLGAKEAIPEIVRFLGHSNPRAREAAIDALVRRNAREAAADVLKLADDVDRQVRGRAIWTLGDWEARDAAPKLRALLRSAPPDSELRRCLAYALGRLGGREAIPELLRTLEDRAPDVRGMAVDSLARLGAAEAVPPLLPLLSDREPSVRGRALQALATLKGPGTIPPVRRLLSDPVKSNRWLAAQALAELGAKEAIPDMIPLLRDDDVTLVGRVLEALKKLGAREAAPEIVKVFRRNLFGTREAALAALVALEAKSELLDLLKSSGAEGRAACAAALCELGSSEGVPALLESGGDLTALNALRQPAAYAKLRAARPGALQGTARQVVERLAEDAGMAVEFPSAEALADAGAGFSAESGSAWDLLRRSVNPIGLRYQIVLEADRVRVLERDDAARFWSEWWKRSGGGR
jgi:HEAT repeat protein